MVYGKGTMCRVYMVYVRVGIDDTEYGLTIEHCGRELYTIAGGNFGQYFSIIGSFSLNK